MVRGRAVHPRGQRDGVGGLTGLLGIAFAVSERRSDSPLLPTELLRRPLALRADLVIFFAAAGLLAMFFFQTLYLQQVLGFSPLKTALTSSRPCCWPGSGSGWPSSRSSGWAPATPRSATAASPPD